MSVDSKQALRLVLCLANPSALQGARWGGASVDTKQALRLVLSLTNPSRMQGARWTAANVFLANPSVSGTRRQKVPQESRRC